MALEKGALLHKRYRIELTIAAGGMGAVYRATDETLGISVAVKENFFTTEEHSKQFRLEATILASLRHPNITRVTDHFVIPGQGQYLVMDFIDGTDLRQLIDQQGPVAEEEVIRIGTVICGALQYLHSRSPAIVHRDIKPGNLKITPARQVYLVDFGLAKLSQGEATTTGAQALTPGYAPPEQYGQGTNPLSDIYSLGATLYAALTGKVPEDGLGRLMGTAELTPIRKHNPQISERTARVIERALEVMPANRYASAEAFKQALQLGMSKPPAQVELRAEPPPSQTPTRYERPIPTPPSDSPVNETGGAAIHAGAAQALSEAGQAPALNEGAYQPKKSKTGLWIGLAAFVVLGGVAAFALRSGMFQPPAPTALAAAVTATSAPATQTAPATLVEAQSTAKPTETIIPTSEPASTITPEPSPAPVEASATPTLAATPLGGGLGQIAFASDRSGSVQVWTARADGSDPKQITSLPDGACQPDWSPDGKQLVFIIPCSAVKDEYSGASLYLINADGKGIIPLPSSPGGDFDPAWSPDGSMIAFTSLREGMAHIFVMNLADKSVRRLSPAVNHERRAAWSPDGARLVYETTRLGQPQIWMMDANGANAHEFSPITGGLDYSPAWSPDGATVVYSQGSQPQLISRQTVDKTAREIAIPSKIRPVQEARYSLDGYWIAFTSKQDGNTDIYCMRSNGSNLVRFTDNSGLDFHPAWRP